MTVTTNAPAGVPAEPPADLVTVSVDGVALSVPKGTLVIRAAELVGVQVPRFCDHPLLDPVAACRMCLVEIVGQPKPQPACAITVSDGMQVKTQVSSEVADAAQRGVMEFLLINHPLDCPICDKGGECPLQNQAMSNGRAQSRFDGAKRTFPKPINISAQVLLDRERCVSCARCTRFAEQIAGDPFIELLERGARQQVGISPDTPFNSYFSGNTVQICPVGALTSARYRFRSRPFDLVSTPTVCEHCAGGCGLRTDERRGSVLRRLAWDTPEVNEEWNCDKGRFAFAYLDDDRITRPMIREDGELRVASWPEAIDAAARGLAAAGRRVGVLTGGRLTLEDSYAYSRFARAVLGTDDVDFRSRARSAEEADFLAGQVAGRGLGVTFSDISAAATVLLVGLDPEDESPSVFLRLRRAARDRSQRVFSIAPYASRGLHKAAGTLLPTVPGQEATVLTALAGEHGTPDGAVAALATALREPGAVILAGPRLAEAPGALTALVALTRATGAAWSWIPRRAGERGAVDAGLLPGLLPGGRPLTDERGRTEVAAAWGVQADELPTTPGRDATAIVAAALATDLDEDGKPLPAAVQALLVAGLEPADDPDPAALLAALDAAPFLVSLETRNTAVTDRADVVLPVAVVTEKAGTFVNHEGRVRPFGKVMRDSAAFTDARVLAMLAEAMDRPMGRGDLGSLRTEVDALGAWSGPRAPEPAAVPVPSPQPVAGQAVLSTWAQLLDLGRLQDDEPFLAATRRPAVARLSAATAAEVGVADGDTVVVATDTGDIEVPLVVTEMPDRVVWLPENSPSSTVRATLAAGHGSVVRLGRRGQA